MKWVVAVLCLMLFPFVQATTFLPLSLDELDQQADYIVTGTVVSQNGAQENNTITTRTTISVDEWVKGFSLGHNLVVQERGGIAGDVMMVVPGSPRFVAGERVALFVAEDQPARWWHRTTYGHTVGMAQGKFSLITNESGEELVVPDLGGAHLLVAQEEQKISISVFRARYQQSAIISLWHWLIQVIA